jgi:hypothetical protein
MDGPLGTGGRKPSSRHHRAPTLGSRTAWLARATRCRELPAMPHQPRLPPLAVILMGLPCCSADYSPLGKSITGLSYEVSTEFQPSKERQAKPLLAKAADGQEYIAAKHAPLQAPAAAHTSKLPESPQRRLDAPVGGAWSPWQGADQLGCMCLCYLPCDVRQLFPPDFINVCWLQTMHHRRPCRLGASWHTAPTQAGSHR